MAQVPQTIADGPLHEDPGEIEEVVEAEPSGSASREAPLATPETRSTSDINPRDIENVWLQRNLLTFDGGGIRGFWSLLVVKKLMDHICILEMHPSRSGIPCLQGDADEAPDSFHPLPYKSASSQVKYTAEERRYRRVYASIGMEVEALDPARRYLPCHYFDYIGGTSTGALIATMLGRLRMTVLDCLDEYAKLGNVIFGHPVTLGSVRMYIGSGTKLRTSDAEKAYKDVAKRRTETTGPTATTPRFPSEKHMCNTFVTALHSVGKGVRGTPFVIRSYKSPADGTEPVDERQEPISSVQPRTVYGEQEYEANAMARDQSRKTRIYEDEHDLEIYQVARAATAASRYHRPQKIVNAQGDEMVFEDAGVVEPNPTPRGLSEIRRVHGHNSLGVVVSVGTAKADAVQDKEIGKEWFHATGKRLIDTVTDADNADKDVREDLRRHGVRYFRLNPDKKTAQKYRLNMPLETWEPKTASDGLFPGFRTLMEMKSKFEAWYESSEDVQLQFQACARELVARRRLRAQSAAKWERYIDGSSYTCPLDAHCHSTRQFTFHDKALAHYERKHSDARLTHRAFLHRAKHKEWVYQERVAGESHIL